MACLTLKRPLDLDPLHSPGSRPSTRRRCTPVTSPSIPSTRDDKASPFQMMGSRLSSEQIHSSIRDEMRRLHGRRHLHFGENNHATNGPSSPSNTLADMADSSSAEFIASVSSHQQTQQPTVSKKEDRALFTFKQVGLICERMLREQESKLREEYEQVLTAKLAEQYDTFVKFTYDQIQKRFETSAAPSYLS